jgi:hypothetical protein
MNMRGSAWNHVAPIAVRSSPDPGDGRLLAGSNRRRQLAFELIEKFGRSTAGGRDRGVRRFPPWRWSATTQPETPDLSA